MFNCLGCHLEFENKLKRNEHKLNCLEVKKLNFIKSIENILENISNYKCQKCEKTMTSDLILNGDNVIYNLHTDDMYCLSCHTFSNHKEECIIYEEDIICYKLLKKLSLTNSQRDGLLKNTRILLNYI